MSASALVCGVLLALHLSCVSAQESEGGVAFTKKVEVFGLYIDSTSPTGDDKLLHTANILAEYIDNDELFGTRCANDYAPVSGFPTPAVSTIATTSGHNRASGAPNSKSPPLPDSS